MRSSSLTKRQNDVYEHIRASFREHGRPPTMAEIGQALEIRSTNAVSKHLRVLEKKGYIRRRAHEARGIELVGADGDPAYLDDDVPSLPLVGRTSSASPHNLRRRPRGFLYTDALLLGTIDEDDCLIGRAGDDGMSDLGIFKGDFLVIAEATWERYATAPGFVAALLLGDLLVTRELFFDGVELRLQPANRSYPEQVFSPDDEGCYVIGPVLSVMRSL